MPLLRGIARTAAIAGTATAVSNRVSRRQQNRWAQQEDQQYAQQQPQPQYAPPLSPRRPRRGTRSHSSRISQSSNRRGSSVTPSSKLRRRRSWRPETEPGRPSLT